MVECTSVYMTGGRVAALNVFHSSSTLRVSTRRTDSTISSSSASASPAVIAALADTRRCCDSGH
jgi:hypothetical protein